MYYHRKRTPFPRVVAGTPDAWDKSIHLSDENYCPSYTWSPCGRFVAAQVRHSVEIRDSLSSELLSTLARPNAYPNGQLAYSPDGHSLASFFNASLTIWDIQTGGAAKEIECGDTFNISLTWSLDGATICAIFYVSSPVPFRFPDGDYAMHVYDVASGTTLSSGTFESRSHPYLWAHGTSFRAITVKWSDQALTIETFEAGSILTKVESSCIESWGQDDRIGSVSTTTYRLSVSNSIRNQVRILDIRKSECLLEESGEDGKFDPYPGRFPPHCFSPDGNLFATYSLNSIHIWKYTSGRYTPWRNLPAPITSASDLLPPRFSPTSSSILGCSDGLLQVWRLDGPHAAAHIDNRSPFAVLSHCGTYIATGRVGGNTVTITNLYSRTPPQFIDTNMKIGTLALTGNVLLVWGSGKLVAWRLTEKGMVSGVSADRRAGRGDSIWVVSISYPRFWVGDQTVVIKGEVSVPVYHTETGELLESTKIYRTGTGELFGSTQTSLDPRGHQYSILEMHHCQHYPNYRKLNMQDIPPEDKCSVTQAGLDEGWVEDLEGKHRLWIPPEWRMNLYNAVRLCNMALLLKPRCVDVIIML